MKRRHFFMVNAKKIAHALKGCRFFIVLNKSYTYNYEGKNRQSA